MNVCTVCWSVCEVSASHPRWWNSLGCCKVGCQEMKLPVCHWQSQSFVSSGRTLLKSTRGRKGFPPKLLLVSGAAHSRWLPLCVPCSAAANWSDRAAQGGNPAGGAGFVKPHTPELRQAAHCYCNEPSASCITFCQKLLTFFVSIL